MEQEHTPYTAPEAVVCDKAAEPAKVEIVGVSFRGTGKTYYFAPGNITAAVGDTVIVETARGAEIGRVTIANRMVPESEIVPPLRQLVRLATPADLSRYEENKRLEEQAAKIFREKVAALKLPMNLTSVEYTFDNSKLIFYFTAENRVDFRELVKNLASVFKTRIELRQIGIRDEARMMGGFGVCGRPFCCSSFLPDFVQVSIKMAKEQNFSLNSSKISGACGRLMCCLRYEHDTYEEALRITPSVGSVVSTGNGVGVVVEARPLTGVIKVRLDEKNEAPRLYRVEDIQVIRSKGKGGLQPAATADAEERPAAESVTPAPEKAAEKPQNARRGGGKPPRRNQPPRNGKPGKKPDRAPAPAKKPGGDGQ